MAVVVVTANDYRCERAGAGRRHQHRPSIWPSIESDMAVVVESVDTDAAVVVGTKKGHGSGSGGGGGGGARRREEKRTKAVVCTEPASPWEVLPGEWRPSSYRRPPRSALPPTLIRVPEQRARSRSRSRSRASSRPRSSSESQVLHSDETNQRRHPKRGDKRRGGTKNVRRKVRDQERPTPRMSNRSSSRQGRPAKRERLPRPTGAPEGGGQGATRDLPALPAAAPPSRPRSRLGLPRLTVAPEEGGQGADSAAEAVESSAHPPKAKAEPANYAIGQSLRSEHHSLPFASAAQASSLLGRLPLDSPLFVKRTDGRWTYAILKERKTDRRTGRTKLVVSLSPDGSHRVKVLDEDKWERCLRLARGRVAWERLLTKRSMEALRSSGRSGGATTSGGRSLPQPRSGGASSGARTTSAGRSLPQHSRSGGAEGGGLVDLSVAGTPSRGYGR